MLLESNGKNQWIIFSQMVFTKKLITTAFVIKSQYALANKFRQQLKDKTKDSKLKKRIMHKSF